MEKKYYDSEQDKSLDKKLSAFYNHWDSLSAEEKDQLMADVQEIAQSISQTNFAELSDEELTKLRGETESLMKLIVDIKAALGHRIVAKTDEFYEHLKKDAENGDEQAKAIWEEVKEEYYKVKLSGIGDN